MTQPKPHMAEQGSVPVPDPTVLTTQTLKNDIAALREILEAKISGQMAIIEARLKGMDDAVKLLQVSTEKQPEIVDSKISNLQKLHEEKFGSIQIQFRERDVRSDQTLRDSKVAVDAALQAAKESVNMQNISSALAIAKSEGATTKTIDQQSMLINTATRAIDDKISDIKDRITRIEGEGSGKKENKGDNMALIAILVALGSVITQIIFSVMGK